MHDEIKKFYLEGELAEVNIVETKERIVHHLENMMRDYGFVPSIDNEPQFTLQFNPETEAFDFKLTVYGVKVDKERAWGISGITSGKEISKSIRRPKLKPLLNTAV
jgi:hypothetical protein